MSESGGEHHPAQGRAVSPLQRGPGVVVQKASVASALRQTRSRSPEGMDTPVRDTSEMRQRWGNLTISKRLGRAAFPAARSAVPEEKIESADGGADVVDEDATTASTRSRDGEDEDENSPTNKVPTGTGSATVRQLQVAPFPKVSEKDTTWEARRIWKEKWDKAANDRVDHVRTHRSHGS